jgi:hypothetical protein
MPIRGPLRELGIHDVFQLLDLTRKTGTLRVTSELRQNEGVIWFESGTVIAARVRSNPHPIGDVLLRSGKVREEDLVRAAAMQREGDPRRLGEILLAIGAVSSRDLERQVRTQVEEVVFAVLGWSEGHFEFEEGAARDAPRDAAINIPVQALLMEGARRIDEWTRLQGRVPHLGVIPRLAEADESGPGSLELNPLEWRVLAACDGHLDVRGVARAVAASDFDAARALFGLAAAGVIVLQDPAVVPVAPVRGPDVATLLSQAEGFLRQGDPVAAQSVAEAVVAAAPADPRGYLVLGRAHFAERRFAAAEHAFRGAVRLDPGSAPGLRLLGLAQSGQGRFPEALQAWDAWLALAPRPREEQRHHETVTRLRDAVRILLEALPPTP